MAGQQPQPAAARRQGPRAHHQARPARRRQLHRRHWLRPARLRRRRRHAPAPWPGGEWSHLERDPDGELFTVYAPVKTATLPNGPGGFAYVPKGSPGFVEDHVIVSEWSTNTVGVYQANAQGDPGDGHPQELLHHLPAPLGRRLEPLTGDFMFLTWGAGVDRVYIVQGFKAPPPIPQ